MSKELELTPNEQVKALKNHPFEDLRSQVTCDALCEAQHEKTLRLATPDIEAKERERIIGLLETFGIDDRSYPALWQAIKEGGKN